MSDSEYQKLQKIKLKDKLENSTDLPATQDDSGNELATATRKNIARRMLGANLTEKSKLKRKKAKVRTLQLTCLKYAGHTAQFMYAFFY